jgi:ribonuclease P protein component
VLPTTQRLRQSAAIERVVKTGALMRTPYVLLYRSPAPGQPTSRVACIVSKRVSKSAVVRHRYQRWLRQYARHVVAQKGPVFDIVLVARPSLATLTTSAALFESLPHA